MNQILQVQEKRNKNKSSSVDIKKVILFFSVCLIIFGIIMIGQGAYSVYQNQINKPVEPDQGENLDILEYIPDILLTQTEDNKLKINVNSQIAISHIIYNWNNDNAVTLDELGKTNIEEIIDIPAGESVINISIIDTNGKETKKQATYIVEQSKPVIELSVVGNNIKIIVTSEVELSYVTCKWNLEEEQKYDMITFENKKKFEKELEIPKGQNTLKIVAVDNNEVKTEKSQEIKGIAKLKDPKVIVSGEYISFSFNAEENMKTVEFIFNGKKYLMNTDTFGTTKEVKYKMKMISGWNYLKIIGKTENGAENTTIWKYEYKTQ